MDLLEMHLWMHNQVRLAFLTASPHCRPMFILESMIILFRLCADKRGVPQPVGMVPVVPPEVHHLALVCVETHPILVCSA